MYIYTTSGHYSMIIPPVVDLPFSNGFIRKIVMIGTPSMPLHINTPLLKSRALSSCLDDTGTTQVNQHIYAYACVL